MFIGMRASIRKGLGFGLTSGIITTLGMIVGLDSTTHSTKVVIGGVLIIAVADALSDALGMHISEESTTKHTQREVWESTLATLLSKFFFALTFVVPIAIFPLSTAILVSVSWGLLLIVAFSFYIAHRERESVRRAVGEHLAIAIIVILITHFVGDWVGTAFGNGGF